MERLELLEDFPPSTEVVDRWRRLAVARESVFASPEWFRAWLEANPGDRSSALLWFAANGELAGVLPLVVGGGRGSLLRPAGGQVADWFTPVCAERDEAAFAGACASLLAERGAGRGLELDRVLDDCSWPDALLRVWPGRAATAVSKRIPQTLPYIALDGGYEGWLAGRSRNFRSQLGRRRRQLERDGRLELRQTASERDLDRDMTTFVELHQARWAERGRPGALTATTEAFHRELAVDALRLGWLRLWTMELDGRPIASWYGWRVGDRYLYYLSGFDPEAGPGVGTVLLAQTIAAAAEEGATTYDMLAGDETYKRRFETGRRSASSYVVASRLGSTRLRTALSYGGRSLARRARARARGWQDRRGS